MYAADLARIHAEAFGEMGRSAGRHLVELLHSRGVRGGLVVELGCGAGALAEVVVGEGFGVWGVDASAAMVGLARQRVPAGAFEVGTVESATLPRCVAVVAAGEVLNYVPDPPAGEPRLSELFRRVGDALLEGGVLLFDAAAPGRGTGAVGRHWECDDWAVLVDVEERQDTRTLIRRITTFVRAGERFRRSREVHRLELFAPEAVAALLSRAGFSVAVREGYAKCPMPGGLPVFEAIKVGQGSRAS